MRERPGQTIRCLVLFEDILMLFEKFSEIRTKTGVSIK